MIHVESVKRSMQTKFVLERPGDNLDNNHIAKFIVYLVEEYAKEKPYLFTDRNCEGKRGPKFKHDLKEMLGLHTFATLRLQRSCRKIEAFLSDNSEACKYITNNKLPKKSQINSFKNDYGYLIEDFLAYTVNFAEKYGLLDFEVVSLDSTTIEASVDEYRRLSYDKLCYLENLIKKYGKSKGKRSIWRKLKNFFYKKELNDKIADLVDEIYKNLNKHGRELLIIALKSKKAYNEILDIIFLLKSNCDEGKTVNLTDPKTRRVLTKKGKIRFGYLIQTVTDTKTGIILMQNVVSEQTDANQLIPAIDYLYQTYGKLPKYILADNGYYQIEALEYAFINKITPIIPDRSESMKNNGTQQYNPYAKCNMPFDPIKKSFYCPYCQELKPTAQKIINGVLNDEYTTNKCPECPYHDKCAKSQKYRKLYEPVSPVFIEEKLIFQSKDGKELYKLRPIYSEGNFANLKSHQEFTKARRIGIDKVDIDLKLEAIVINLKKIVQHLNITLI